MKRAMFSIITIASSTTKPVAIVSAISVRLLIEKPARYITPNVPTSDSGTATDGMIVAGMLRRNRKMTITTSTIARISSKRTSSTDARIVVVRSVSSVTWTEPGSDACNCGSSCLMRSTTSITFAPGWRCTLTMMAGVAFAQAASRTFSAPSTTSATSDSLIGAPSL